MYKYVVFLNKYHVCIHLLLIHLGLIHLWLIHLWCEEFGAQICQSVSMPKHKSETITCQKDCAIGLYSQLAMNEHEDTVMILHHRVLV